MSDPIMDGEALHSAMNKARIAQSLPEDYLREILKRVESETPRTDAVSEPFMGTQSYQAMADHARELERELTKANKRIEELELEIRDMSML